MLTLPGEFPTPATPVAPDDEQVLVLLTGVLPASNLAVEAAAETGVPDSRGLCGGLGVTGRSGVRHSWVCSTKVSANRGINWRFYTWEMRLSVLID